MTDSTPRAAELREAVQAGFPAAVADLTRLVRIPSVSWDGFDPEHVQRSAEAVAQLARDTGVFDAVEVVRTPIPGKDEDGLPAVLATRPAQNGRPTVLLYAHHDVQPPGEDADWETKPYEPTLRGDRLAGRGAADDKAGVTAHIAAIRALVAAGIDPQVGIVLYAEGEEEFGSRSLPTFLDRFHDRLAADVIVVADSGNWDLDTPALTVALRGMVAFNLRITTLGHAVHSGMFGGTVPDAMMAATRLLATLWDEDGSVAVDGLRGHEAATPAYDEARLREESGLPDHASPIGRGEILHREWYQPSITVTGIDAPSVLNASNTLIPSVRVRIASRVAPGQDAAEFERLLREHLVAHAPYGAKLDFDEDVDRGEAFLAPVDGWAVEHELAALREAWEAEPVVMGAGGSIPFTADLVRHFPEAQILITGVEDPDSRAHSPNESVHLPSLQRSILAEAFLLARLDAGSIES
jgi:acetylornithine deacetylase/succinyl-diaminopimelate desuccinylase-like protein